MAASSVETTRRIEWIIVVGCFPVRVLPEQCGKDGESWLNELRGKGWFNGGWGVMRCSTMGTVLNTAADADPGICTRRRLTPQRLRGVTKNMDGTLARVSLDIRLTILFVGTISIELFATNGTSD